MEPAIAEEYVESLRRLVIGEPEWLATKTVFEYSEQSIRVVVILKLVRAVHALNAMDLLCEKGLFIDFGAIVRCFYEVIFEVYFLLESHQDPSENAKKFVAEFFSRDIDGYLTSEQSAIPTKKILAGASRYISSSGEAREVYKALELQKRVYKTFSGYIHASYSHVMEVYGPKGIYASFNCSGVPSDEQKRMRREHIAEGVRSCLIATSLAAYEFGQKDLYVQIKSER